MKFSRRVYPILEAAEKKIFSKLNIPASFTDEINDYLDRNGKRQEWHTRIYDLLSELDSNIPRICYFAKTIREKAELIKYKLFDIFPEIPESAGVFLFPDTSSVIYKWQDNTLQTIHFGQVQIIEAAVLKFGEVDGKKGISIDRIPEPGISPDGTKLLSNSHHTDGTLMPWITLIWLAFYHFAEIEVKIISSDKGGDKRVVVNDEKYVNETIPKIEIIDSNWFTRIVRLNGFPVSGHFRLQPYGTNLSKRRLIWIDDFEKQGYTRKASLE